jgi:hypothetical protein
MPDECPFGKFPLSGPNADVQSEVLTQKADAAAPEQTAALTLEADIPLDG